MSDPITPPAATKFVGAKVSRVDGKLKVTGKADYSADYYLPNMAWAFAVKSTIAKGQISNLDISAAQKAPGVLSVFTPANRPRMYPPKTEQSSAGIVSEPLAPLAGDAIYYYGQDIAYVVAETYEQAREAASLVRAKYDVQSPMTSAMGSKVEAPSTVNGEKPHMEKKASGVSAVVDAWNSSPFKIEATYETAYLHHHPMEPHAVVATWDNDERLTFYTPSQWMYGTRNFLAQSLNIQKEHVRVISHFVGGAFGCKGSSWMYMLMVAVAAKELKRPVKYVMERENMFTSVGYRPMTTQHIQLGAGSNGALIAMRHHSKTSQSTVGPFVEPAGHTSSAVLYASPNIEIDHQIYKLDLNGPTFMRAPGESSGIHALETAMDELAVELKMDPVQLRLANMTNTHPMKELPFSSRNLDECYRVGAEKFGWSTRAKTPRATVDGEWLVGSGMATASFPAYRSPATAKVRILADGSAQVDCACHDLGTGTYTIMAQVAADELGLPIEKVTARLGDSTQPEAPVAGGSQSTASVLPAVQMACRSALEQLQKLASADKGSPLHTVKMEDMEADAEGLRANADKNRRQSFASILEAAGKGAVEATESVDPASEKQMGKQQSMFSSKTTAYQSFGAFFVEVRVHKLTHEVRVSKVTAIMDIGQPINLKTARSQIIGGAVFGIGAALTEHSILDAESGQWITQDLGTYHVPVHADIPAIDVHFVGPPDYKFNSLGARGVGEIGNTGMSAAIGNAV
ncbi:MAG: xanthine dehydrogenase family protein molybdopterin-binding subunit [Candidatus Methylacidiphilales bacterium]